MSIVAVVLDITAGSCSCAMTYPIFIGGALSKLILYLKRKFLVLKLSQVGIRNIESTILATGDGAQHGLFNRLFAIAWSRMSTGGQEVGDSHKE